MRRTRSEINIKGDEKIIGRLNGAEEEMDLRETDTTKCSNVI
jgi:hypothetical protein